MKDVEERKRYLERDVNEIFDRELISRKHNDLLSVRITVEYENGHKIHAFKAWNDQED